VVALLTLFKVPHFSFFAFQHLPVWRKPGEQPPKPKVLQLLHRDNVALATEYGVLIDLIQLANATGRRAVVSSGADESLKIVFCVFHGPPEFFFSIPVGFLIVAEVRIWVFVDRIGHATEIIAHQAHLSVLPKPLFNHACSFTAVGRLREAGGI
jgi:hypothetical protein